MKRKQTVFYALLTAATVCLVIVTVVLSCSSRPAAGLILQPLEIEENDSGYRLNINTAGALELEALPGIGPALAQRILETREELGFFSGKDDLLAVYGIGEGTYAKIEPYITFK